MLKPDLAPISWHVFQWTTVPMVITEATIEFPTFSPSLVLDQKADRWAEQCQPMDSPQAELGLVVFGCQSIVELGKVHTKFRFASSFDKQGLMILCSFPKARSRSHSLWRSWSLLASCKPHPSLFSLWDLSHFIIPSAPWEFGLVSARPQISNSL